MRALLLAAALVGCAGPRLVCESQLWVSGLPTITARCADGHAVRVLCEYEAGCQFTVPCRVARLSIAHDGEPIERSVKDYPDGMPRSYCVYRTP